MRNHILLVVALFAVGCVTDKALQSDKPAKISCASAAAALKVLTAARQDHKLSAEQIALVDSAKDKTDTVCKTAPYPTLSSIQIEAVADLMELASKFGEQHE